MTADTDLVPPSQKAAKAYADSRTLYSNTTAASHTGDTNETTLMTYSMPANTLTAGDSIRLVAMGTSTGATASRTGRVYFGATKIGEVVFVGTAFSGGWVIECDLMVRTTSVQIARGRSWNRPNDADQFTYNDPAEDTTGSIDITVKGLLGNAADTITAETCSIVKEVSA
jgi:hypothetical protein